MTICIYLMLVIFGWFSVCGASYDYGEIDFFSFDTRAGRQFVWICCSLGLGFILMMLEDKLYDMFAYILYGAMLLLLLVGPALEEKYGSRALLLGIGLTALISGVLQCLFFPGTVLLGASGIVFMLIMLSSLAGMRSGSIPLTLVLTAALYLGQEVYAILFVSDQVANFMHLVGGACGTAFGFAAARRSDPP